MGAPPPVGCEWSAGASPVLLVAPHGGRRPPVDPLAPPPRLRVNDVYTPEVTRALAAAVGAGYVINRALDRNRLDLNRISQVRRHAPWFLELLVDRLAESIARHGRAEIVFVHGWNTGQPVCDVGIGAVESGGNLHVPAGAQRTVSDRYLRTRIAALQVACTAAGIRTAIGQRYPASHRNNLLQLFSAGAAARDEPAARRLAAWAVEERLNALQLELGIPLRWPGPWRERFVAAMRAAFGAEAAVDGEKRGIGAGDDEPRRASAPPEPDAAGDAPAALQWYDPRTDIGVVAGVTVLGPRLRVARLLLFLGGQRAALFTGEARGVHGLRLCFQRAGGALRVAFVGSMLLLDDAARYADLEAALAASRLIEVRLSARFQPLLGVRGRVPQFGNVEGEMAIDGAHFGVAAAGFADAAGWRAEGGTAQTMIAAALGRERGLLWRGAEDAPGTGLRFAAGATQSFAARVVVAHDGDPYTPAGMELHSDGQAALRVRPLSRMSILRPLGAAGYLRVTFGICRCVCGGARGFGLYEHARPVACPR